MLNGSAKISSDNSSFLEKALLSIFVQDQRPITERQGIAVIAGLLLFCQGMFVVQWHNIISVLLKSFKFYWLTKKKRKRCTGLIFPSWDFFFFPFTKWLQHACASLTREAVVPHCPIPAQYPFQTHLSSAFSVFPPFQCSKGNWELLTMEVGQHLPLARSLLGGWQSRGTRTGWWTCYALPHAKGLGWMPAFHRWSQ